MGGHDEAPADPQTAPAGAARHDGKINGNVNPLQLASGKCSLAVKVVHMNNSRTLGHSSGYSFFKTVINNTIASTTHVQQSPSILEAVLGKKQTTSTRCFSRCQHFLRRERTTNTTPCSLIPQLFSAITTWPYFQYNSRPSPPTPHKTRPHWKT